LSREKDLTKERIIYERRWFKYNRSDKLFTCKRITWFYLSNQKGESIILRDNFIYGLQDLISNKVVQMENRVEVLNNYIKLIRENK